MMTVLLTTVFCFASADAELPVASDINTPKTLTEEKVLIEPQAVEKQIANGSEWKINNALGGYGWVAKEIVMQAANLYAPSVGKSVINTAGLLTEKIVNKGISGIGMQDLSEIADAEFMRYFGVFNGNIAMALKNTVGTAAYQMLQGQEVNTKEILWNAFKNATTENFKAFKQDICFGVAGVLGNAIYKAPNAEDYNFGAWNPQYQVDSLTSYKKITGLQVQAYNNASLGNTAVNIASSAYAVTSKAASFVYNWFNGSSNAPEIATTPVVTPVAVAA